MTDEQIIKALECCSKGFGNCDGCPYDDDNNDCVTPKGETLMMRDVIALINRKDAEIERLKKTLDNMTDALVKTDEACRKAKSKAYREFAKKVKTDLLDVCGTGSCIIITSVINNTLKEITDHKNHSVSLIDGHIDE